MKKLSILILLALLAFGQTAWAQNSQTVYLTNNNPEQSLTVDETVEMVWVYANFTGIPDSNTGQFELTVPEGCIMKLSGDITSGQASISWNGGSSGGYTTNFSDYWVYASPITIQMSSNPGQEINITIEVAIYNPNAIKEAESLQRFISYTEVSDLGVVDNITLNNYLTIGQNRVVTIDLNDHTLQRNLTNATSNGCVIVVAQTGTLTLTDGTVSGGNNSSTSGNTPGGIMNIGTLTLTDVTIDNCHGKDGGGIWNDYYATLTITNGAITNCSSVAGGGAMVNRGTATINGCTMSDNTATTRGGAIWSDGSLTSDGCIYKDNEALCAGTGGDGGALHLDGGTTNLSNVIITGNTSKYAGGIFVESFATLTITGNSTISDNRSSENRGGGIVSNGTTTISGCTFSGNMSSTYGGGIWARKSLTLTNCTFINNRAIEQGGALCLYETSIGTVTLTNCTFTDNYAYYGGAIWNNGSLSLEGCAIRNNSANEGGAIYISSEAPLSIKGGSITGNSSNTSGGGITNYGTLTLWGDHLQVKENTASVIGGGIANYGTLQIAGHLQVKDNTPDDVYLPEGHVIDVEGNITSGANSIGVNMEKPGVFTNGYGTTGTSTVPFFAYGINGVRVLDEGEFIGECAWVYGYIECSWDEDNQTVVHTQKLLTESFQNLCTSAFANGGGLQPGWYIVEGTANIGSHYFTCVPDGGGDVHIVLTDDASITMNGLYVNNDYSRSLHIYCQSYGERMGKLTAINTHNVLCAGIGSSIKDNIYFPEGLGDIYIHGGDIHGEVYDANHTGQLYDGAGIGAGRGAGGGIITIYDGKVYAQGGIAGPGIGSKSSTAVTIHGGTITAKGGMGGAGIGTCPVMHGGMSICITGGTVDATGGDGSHGTSDAIGRVFCSAGAGIGSGGNPSVIENFNINITGGKVTAQGGTGYSNYGDECHGGAAGIGSGGDMSSYGTNHNQHNQTNFNVTISGGEVYAHGGGFDETVQHDGAGIGGGYSNPGCNVVINGGIVTAIAGLDGSSAIGAGCDYAGTNNGTLSLPDSYSVRAGASQSQITLCLAEERVYKCMHQFYALIEPCEHRFGTWSPTNTDIVCTACTNCVFEPGSEVHKPYTHINYDARWDIEFCWFQHLIPNHQDAQVVLESSVTIPNGITALVGNITAQEGATITIEDGGQLIHSNEGVVATVEKNITACNGNGGYYLLTNPIMDEQNPETIGMLDNDYDLYGFDHSEELEWRNYEQQSFDLENGIGYLYANSTNTDIAFNGVLNRANANVSIPVTYDGNADFKGLNLVGNPFVCDAYLLNENNGIIPFFKISADGDTLVAAQAGTAIKPCEGVFVICPNDGQSHSVVFTTTTPANLGEAGVVPSMLLPAHDLLVHQDASLNFIQTIILLQGWNWGSTYLDITLDDLKAALVEALPEATSITIKSQSQNTSYNGSMWRGSLNALDVALMYEIQVPASCTITLTGTPINPIEHPVNIIANGNTWIGFPLDESKSVDEAFGTFPVAGDIIKSKGGRATYTGTMWRGTLENLAPGQGYIYKSASGEVRTFTFPVSNR